VKPLKKFKLIFVLTLLWIGCIKEYGFSQRFYISKYKSEADLNVYIVNYASQADLKVYQTRYKSEAKGNRGFWYFVPYKSIADKKIFFVDYKSQADLMIYMVPYKSKAGWVKKNKMHLLF
jgi:hypothetical protein